MHALPAWADLRRALPQANVSWVVEPAFAPLLRLAGVSGVIEAPLRSWRGRWFSAEARTGRAQLRAALQADAWDAVIDLQGLVKSAWVMKQCRLAEGGFTAGLGNRTDGSGWEWPVRWMQQRSLRLPRHVHAVQRSRLLVAAALGLPEPEVSSAPALRPARASPDNTVALVHGTSRADKLWPETQWVELGQHLVRNGFTVALPAAGADERSRAARLAQAIGVGAHAWREMPLDELAVRMASCAGCVGVDSGVSHIAVALGLPHVQIYNLPTAWRTGPLAGVFGTGRQVAVEAHAGEVAPSTDAVLTAWQQVAPAVLPN